MPRRKSNLGRRTRHTEGSRRRLSNMTEEERASVRERNRLSTIQTRSVEQAERRAARLEDARLRARQSRSAATNSVRSERNERERVRIAETRTERTADLHLEYNRLAFRLNTSLNQVMEDMDKTTKTHTQEQVECRACLQKFEYDAGLLDIFQPWDPPWDGMGDSIAQDMAQITNVDITPTDEFSKLICQFCYQKLLEACSFIMNVRINDRLLRKRVETLHDHETIWPKPIQVNRNINSDVFNTSMDVPSKQDESSDNKSYANGADEGFKGVEGLDGTDTYSNLGIKIEPEEIMQPPPIQITVNGTITQDQFEQNSIVMNGDHKLPKPEPETEPTPEICFANGAKEKKATKEEILRKKREAERKRYEKIKNDPQKREELREKERHQYRKKKEKGTRKLVGNMTPREHQDAKKKWKEHCTKYRNKKKV